MRSLRSELAEPDSSLVRPRAVRSVSRARMVFTGGDFDVENLYALSDDAGGIYILWNDNRTGNMDIYGVRLGYYGEIISGWGEYGNDLQIITDPRDQILNDVMMANGTVVYSYEDTDALGKKSVHLGGVTATGDNPLISGGRHVADTLLVSDAVNNQQNSKLSLITNGIGITYESFENNPAESDIYAQVFNGTFIWGNGGVAVTTEAGNQTNPRIFYDKNSTNAVYIVWDDARLTTPGNYYTHLDDTGSPTVGCDANGSLIYESPFPSETAVLVPKSDGILFTFYIDENNIIQAAGYNTSCTLMGNLTISHPPAGSIPSNLRIAKSPNINGVFVTWTSRTNADTNIFAQALSGTGTLFGPGGTTDLQVTNLQGNEKMENFQNALVGLKVENTKVYVVGWDNDNTINGGHRNNYVQLIVDPDWATQGDEQLYAGTSGELIAILRTAAACPTLGPDESCAYTSILGGQLSFTEIPDNTLFVNAYDNTSLPSFNNPDGTATDDIVTVSDLRNDPAGGFEVQLSSTAFQTLDGLLSIPLDYLYVLTTLPRTTGATLDETNGVEYGAGCTGSTSNVTGSVNAPEPISPIALSTLSTYTTNGSALGTSNTTTPVVLMSSPATQRRCNMSQAVSYAIDLPAFKTALGTNIPAGTYTTTFTYTLISI